MPELNFTCSKCGNTRYEIGEFRAAGGFLSKLFDVQSKRFTTVTCTKSQYTPDIPDRLRHYRQYF